MKEGNESLGALISQFGAYAAKYEVGTTFRYDWKPDQNVQIALRVSKEPRCTVSRNYGFSISPGQ